MILTLKLQLSFILNILLDGTKMILILTMYFRWKLKTAAELWPPNP